VEAVRVGDAQGFHMKHFPQGHRATDYATWLSTSTADAAAHLRAPLAPAAAWTYSVEPEACFEPYVLVRAGEVPLYDERFRGYGMNKISHLEHLIRRTMAKGLQIKVLRGHFVVATEHQKSDDWRATYGMVSKLAHAYETSEADLDEAGGDNTTAHGLLRKHTLQVLMLLLRQRLDRTDAALDAAEVDDVTRKAYLTQQRQRHEALSKPAPGEGEVSTQKGGKGEKGDKSNIGAHHNSDKFQILKPVASQISQLCGGAIKVVGVHTL